ncbi:hypothetical protein [Rummeliibacillus sp. SL167]|uniref:hypothetical protein n=1 Tax=Rummeliibacillus sp. SL167 TaxID=2579792 RepID=UPI0011B3A50B|nr:hypothetical protein [Rummeliibacillus sp. SL167]
MNKKLTILKLDPMHAFGESSRHSEKTWKEIDQYDLNRQDLSNIDVLVISNFVDQEYLLKQKTIIENFLADQKIVVFCGHLFRMWLPGVSPFIPERVQTFSDYEVFTTNNNSGIFDGVTTGDMTYNKGVAGFFARGYHPVAHDVEVLLRFKSGHPVTYIDRSSSAGTILVHAGRDLLGYSSNHKTTGRIPDQLYTWLEREVQTHA